MAVPVQIGRFFFSSKKEALDYEAAIRSVDRLGFERMIGPGRFLEEDELEFVLEALYMRHDALEKIGPGVQAIRVVRQGRHTKFVIDHVGAPFLLFGNADVSVQDVIRDHGRDDDYWKRLTVIAAFREAVVGQIEAFRKRVFDLSSNPLCPISGEPLRGHFCDVDHYPVAFKDLLTAFCVEEGLDLLSVSLDRTGHSGRSAKPRLRQDLAARWGDFHRRYAMFRLVRKEAHQRTRTGAMT